MLRQQTRANVKSTITDVLVVAYHRDSVRSLVSLRFEKIWNRSRRDVVEVAVSGRRPSLDEQCGGHTGLGRRRGQRTHDLAELRRPLPHPPFVEKRAAIEPA